MCTRTNRVATSHSNDEQLPVSTRRRHLWPRHPGTIWEVVIIALAILFYFLGRGLVENKVSAARENTYSIIRIERWLGIFREPEIQHWILQHDWLISVADSVYIYGHWPVVISTLVWLLLKHPDQFPAYRSTLLISGAIGLFIFVTYPVAPPRMFPDLGFTDTVTIHTNAYRVLQPPAFTNQYAAMPSLHVGWNLLMGIAIFRNTHYRVWRIFAVVMPLAMYVSTILTANHLIVDGIAGMVITVLSLLIATRFRTWRDSMPPTLIRNRFPTDTL